MAKPEKENGPPREIIAPTSIKPIMQAFHAESEEIACCLIKKSVHAILGDDRLSKQELKGILSLMSGFNPSNSLEALYAAQMVACHMFGMRKMANDYTDDRRLGLKLLRFSNEAMLQVTSACNGVAQNVTVRYQ